MRYPPIYEWWVSESIVLWVKLPEMIPRIFSRTDCPRFAATVTTRSRTLPVIHFVSRLHFSADLFWGFFLDLRGFCPFLGFLGFGVLAGLRESEVGSAPYVQPQAAGAGGAWTAAEGAVMHRRS